MTIHFTAIGGAVMHQLAICLSEQGHRVSGSDDEIYDPARANLAEAGLLPAREGFFADRIHRGLDLVIAGMHARADNVELRRAEELGVRVLSFPEYVGEAARDKARVVVAGSHGKTSTTALLLRALQHAGRDADFLVGATLPGTDRSVRLTDAPLMVIEGDEYPASALRPDPKFLFYDPHIVILTGIAWDHVNVFPTLAEYLDAFRRFLAGLRDGTTVIHFAGDEVLTRLVGAVSDRVQAVPYDTPDCTPAPDGWIVHHDGRSYPTGLMGRHNLQNLEAARCAAGALGLDDRTVLHAMDGFTGADKRLDVLYSTDRHVVIRDFAHAPSKARASLRAVRETYPHRRLVACLELHTYSSLDAGFLPQYAGALDAADEALVYVSDRAMEIKRRPPIAEHAIRSGFRRDDLAIGRAPGDLEHFLAPHLASEAEPVVLMLMSSGRFDGVQVVDEDGGLMRF